MNAESSRSHLILGIIIESTNLTSGAVVKGKVCLCLSTLFWSKQVIFKLWPEEQIPTAVVIVPP